MPIQQMQSDGGLSDITKLLDLVKDDKTTSSTTSNITKSGVQAQINEILGSNQGLAAVAGAGHSAGFYNSSVNTQLVNDLLARQNELRELLSHSQPSWTAPEMGYRR